jgi:hypothetical protein
MVMGGLTAALSRFSDKKLFFFLAHFLNILVDTELAPSI